MRDLSHVTKAELAEELREELARNADLVRTLEERAAGLERCEVQRDAAVEQLLLMQAALLTISKGPLLCDHRRAARKALAELERRSVRPAV